MGPPSGLSFVHVTTLPTGIESVQGDGTAPERPMWAIGGRVGVADGDGEGVAVGVWVGVDVEDGVMVDNGVALSVEVAVGVALSVGAPVGVDVGDGVPVTVGDAPVLPASVGVAVLLSAVAVSLAVGVALSVAVPGGVGQGEGAAAGATIIVAAGTSICPPDETVYVYVPGTSNAHEPVAPGASTIPKLCANDAGLVPAR